MVSIVFRTCDAFTHISGVEGESVRKFIMIGLLNGFNGRMWIGAKLIDWSLWQRSSVRAACVCVGESHISSSFVFGKRIEKSLAKLIEVYNPKCIRLFIAEPLAILCQPYLGWANGQSIGQPNSLAIDLGLTICMFVDRFFCLNAPFNHKLRSIYLRRNLALNKLAAIY